MKTEKMDKSNRPELSRQDSEYGVDELPTDGDEVPVPVRQPLPVPTPSQNLGIGGTSGIILMQAYAKDEPMSVQEANPVSEATLATSEINISTDSSEFSEIVVKKPKDAEHLIQDPDLVSTSEGTVATGGIIISHAQVHRDVGSSPGYGTVRQVKHKETLISPDTKESHCPPQENLEIIEADQESSVTDSLEPCTINCFCLKKCKKQKENDTEKDGAKND